MPPIYRHSCIFYYFEKYNTLIQYNIYDSYGLSQKIPRGMKAYKYEDSHLFWTHHLIRKHRTKFTSVITTLTG